MSVICLAVAICSCSGSMSKDEYSRWIKDYDNGLHVKATHGHFVYDVQYVPGEWKNTNRLASLLIFRNNRIIMLNGEYYVLIFEYVPVQRPAMES